MVCKNRLKKVYDNERLGILILKNLGFQKIKWKSRVINNFPYDLLATKNKKEYIIEISTGFRTLTSNKINKLIKHSLKENKEVFVLCTFKNEKKYLFDNLKNIINQNSKIGIVKENGEFGINNVGIDRYGTDNKIDNELGGNHIFCPLFKNEKINNELKQFEDYDKIIKMMI